jgi:hypothetical protein
VRIGLSLLLLWSMAVLALRIADGDGRLVPYVPDPSPGGDLLDLTSNNRWYRPWSGSGWMTASAIVVRNNTREAIHVTAVRFDRVENLDMGRPVIAGPQQPSLLFEILDGWPPARPEGRSGPWPPATHQIRDFPVPPAALPSSMAADLAPDQVNDATVLVKIRPRDPSRDGHIYGVTITYRIGDDARVVHFPDVEFGICTAARFRAGTCPVAQN